ncbi:hypothetical protein ACFQXB_03440 [Plastorhodobacter daqingensis]|uniref:Uncharacterized protein n=1 Tax=Plastorhodobacter daqingensis TaxID=1387281 RepID=A0ABW2UEZ8_9RHOB
MNKPLIAALSALLLISACSTVRESRANPLNWFGRSTPVTTLEPAGGLRSIADDPRPLVAEIVDMRVESIPGGAIVRATARQPVQGWWNAALLAENEGRAVDGAIRFRFVAAPPPAPQRVSTPQSRELTAAIFVPAVRLANARQITVSGAQNARSSSR